MNLIKTKWKQYKNILKYYGAFYLFGCALVLGMKYFYSKAGSDQLLWILTPTTRWVSILSGIPFTYEPGAGYANHSLRYLIAPSCSGVQFMMILTAMLFFSFLHRIAPLQNRQMCDHTKINVRTHALKCLGWMLCSIIGSYLLTILINGIRILVAIYLPESLNKLYTTCENPRLHMLLGRMLSPEQLHTVIGIVMYFTALLAIYRIADTLLSKASVSLAGCLVPAFWYFLIVLGIPLLNSANGTSEEQFRSYALLVSSVCAGVLLLYYVIQIPGNTFRKLHDKRNCQRQTDFSQNNDI